MKPHLFIGPSTPDLPPEVSDRFEIRDPAKCGDIAQSVMEGAPTIGLVDGVFENSRSVWHKEILWGLSRGVKIVGAASMGALRAAELYPFGMVGIGEIFRQFQSGILEDDDEVAVLHGPKEFRYKPLSESMINIRLTILSAIDNQIISRDKGEQLIGLVKSQYYKDRSFESLPQYTILSAEERIALMTWIPLNKIDQKKNDARLLIDCIISDELPVPKRFEFFATEYWKTLSRERNFSH